MKEYPDIEQSGFGGNKVKIEVLDSLRAFAALSVCLFHFVCTTTNYIQNESILFFFSAGKYGVESFFVISGFVIPWSMHSAGYRLSNFFSFFLKRLSRLEPPYIFSIGLAILLLYSRTKWVGNPADLGSFSLERIILHFGYLIPFFHEHQWLNPVYWTLAIEFQFYLLMALLFVPLIMMNQKGRMVIVLAIVLTSIYSPSYLIFYWMPFFLLGILLYWYKKQLITSREYYLITGAAIIFCLIKFPAMAVLYAAIPLYFVLNLQTLKLPLLHTLGRFSYSIYLIHPLLELLLLMYCHII